MIKNTCNYHFQDRIQLSSFIHDCVINVLINGMIIDGNRVTLTLASPGIDRIDDTAKDYGLEEVDSL